jgi:threonine dehydratase
MEDLLRRALAARVGDVLPSPTPLDAAPILSARLGVPVLVKREDLTPIFSFKLRGAYNRMAHLRDAERAKGVVAASAGNHSQGVAYAATRLGIDATIVMPRTTPAIKVDAVRRLGGRVVLTGDDYAAAAAHAAEIARTEGRVSVPPFDDLDVIAGQGTVGLELLHQAPPDLVAVFVPVGGGGLASGIASVMKAVRPGLRVIGVEPDDSDAMGRSLAAGRASSSTTSASSPTASPCGRWDHTFALPALARRLHHGHDRRDLRGDPRRLQDTRTVLEPAGALGRGAQACRAVG